MATVSRKQEVSSKMAKLTLFLVFLIFLSADAAKENLAQVSLENCYAQCFLQSRPHLFECASSCEQRKTIGLMEPNCDSLCILQIFESNLYPCETRCLTDVNFRKDLVEEHFITLEMALLWTSS